MWFETSYQFQRKIRVCSLFFFLKDLYVFQRSEEVLTMISFFVLFLTFGFYLFIYLFMAVLGLRFCARAFSSCSKQGPLFIAVRGPLIVAASLVAGHGLQARRLSSGGSRA